VSVVGAAHLPHRLRSDHATGFASSQITAPSMSNGPGPSSRLPLAVPALAHGDDDQAQRLRGSRNTSPCFQGQIFVIAIDGAIIADENFSNLPSRHRRAPQPRHQDRASFMASAIRSKSFRCCAACPITDFDGIGITDAATLDLSIRAWLAFPSHPRGPHAKLPEGRHHERRPRPPAWHHSRRGPATDRQGSSGSTKILSTNLIGQQVVPLITPIAFGPDGKSLRVNSDLLAGRSRRGPARHEDHLPHPACRS